MKLSPVTKEQWREYCQLCDLPSIYHDPRWLELIESIYPKLKVHRLALKNSEDIHWLLPLVEIRPLGRRNPMLISLPFGNYGGILIPRYIEKTLPALNLQPLKKYFEKSNSFAIELRETENPGSDFLIDDKFKRFIVHFPCDIETLWNKTISGNARTSVRKADKSGIEAVFDHQEAGRIFQNIYERNSSFFGTPTHHVEWFGKMAELFPDEMEVVLAEYNKTYIGALLVLNYQGTSILHAAVTDPQYRKLAITDKLLWATFERLMTKGKSRSFDFGRTRPVKEKLFFKKKWGGEERSIFYSYLLKPGADIPWLLPDNPKLGTAIKVWRLLPMPVKRLVGPYFRVRIPT